MIFTLERRISLMIHTVPCKDCKRRYVGCHSECDSYKEFKRLKAEQDNTIRKNRELENLVRGYNTEKKCKPHLSHH